jgi:hypothetical protein
MNIKKCPFCGSDAELVHKDKSSSDDGYCSGYPARAVECLKCFSVGPVKTFKWFRDFTDYTVADFRRNPSLRAKIDDAYEDYVKRQEEMVITAWNKRILIG